ncbi:MAG: hypothetical protein K2O39_01525, partial [Clostridiales bacterium]|nr:hypothetical protein [Clostridiales bacterium]
DTNGAFDDKETVTLVISLNGYNLVGVVVTDSTGDETEDWMEADVCSYMGDMNDDYTFTITLVSIPTAVVNFSVDNATVTVTADGTTINNGDNVLVGTELTITVTADQGYEVTSVTVNGTEVTDGKYTIAETDTTITIAATVEEVNEKSTTYQFVAKDTGSTSAASSANVKTKFTKALNSEDTDVVSSVVATNVFTSTDNTDNLKFGSSSKQGTLTITFNSNVKVTKIVITAKIYNTDTSQINVDGKNSSTLESTAKEYVFELNGEESVTINITGKRGYIDSIVIYYE